MSASAEVKNGLRPRDGAPTDSSASEGRAEECDSGVAEHPTESAAAAVDWQARCGGGR